MNIQYTPLIYPLLIATFIALGIAYYTWRRSSIIGATSFTVLMLAIAVWTLAYALRLISVDVPAKIFWAKVRYVGIVIAPTAWFIFLLRYIGREKWLDPRVLVALSIEPLITLIVVWTNELHHLNWTSVVLRERGTLLVWKATYGVWHQIHAVYTYGLLLIGLYLILQALHHAPRLYRGQLMTLLFGSLIPVISDTLYNYAFPWFPLEPTPFAFMFAGLLTGASIHFFRLFDMIPIARSVVVENLKSVVFVLDPQSRIVDVNPAAEKLIGLSVEKVVGQPVVQVLPDELAFLNRHIETVPTQADVAVGERIYRLQTSHIRDHQNRSGGALVILDDVTSQKRAEADMLAQKDLLENLIAIARATMKRTSLIDTLQSALNMAVTLTNAEHGSMFLLDGSGVVTHSVLARGKVSPADKSSIVNLVMEKGLAGWVFRHRQPALIADAAQDERWLTLEDAPYTAKSVLCLPISSGSAILGILTLTHFNPNHFNTDHAYLLQSSVNQMAMAIRNAQMYDEQRRLAVRQTTLYETLRAAGEHLDVETITRAAVEIIARLTGWPDVAILLPNEPGTHLVFVSRAGPLAHEAPDVIPLDQGITGRAFLTGKRQYIPDVVNDEDYVAVNSAHRCELAIPLRRGDRMLGVLDVSSDQAGAFDADETLLATYLAEAIALALDNARLYTEVSHYAAGLNTLYTIARSTSRSIVLADVLSETLDTALTSLDFDAGMISLVPANDGERLQLAIERDIPSQMLAHIDQNGLVGTLCQHVHRQKQVLLVSDVDLEKDVVERFKERIPLLDQALSQGIRAFSSIPLQHQDRSIGVLSLFSYKTRPLSSAEADLLTALGQQVATAVTNARLFQAIAGERSRLQAMIESSRDGILMVSIEMDQRVLLVNAPALDLLQIEGSPEEWIERPVQDIFESVEHNAPKIGQFITKEIERARSGDTSAYEGEYSVPPRTIHLLNLPVMSASIHMGRLLVFRDVTEERMLERMREDLTHAMVHDLRNPLTAIHGALSFLADNLDVSLSSTQQQLWDIAQENTQSMLKLVNAILEISRLENRQMPLDQTVISLPKLVSNVLALQLPLAVPKNIQLKSDIPSTLPPVWADASLIERVLKNLVGNAIKFTPENGVICITARLDEENKSKALISVIDNGSGIPLEIQNKLFDKFVIGEQQERGSGLGLAFCKMALEAHGERIWVEDTSEKGTTFTFSLPIPTPRDL
ncbi:MAG TPA: GAF domain-containing protein [Chloroflexi bacterium]|nr:GAF domain-containing protein [Chloroflexota bacterium]